MKKILHIIPNLGIGGTEKILFELCSGMNRAKFQHEVIALKSGGATAEALQKIPVPVTLLHSKDHFIPGLLDFPRLFWALRSKIKSFNPDVVQTWLSRANFIGRIAARAANAPKVISALRVMEIQKQYHLWAERATQNLADCVTVNCSALKNFAEQKIRIPFKKIILISNGIQTNPKPLDENLLNQFKKNWIRPNDFLFGAIGRLHEQKGLDIFLRAAQIVLRQAPQAKFLIAGDGPQRAELEALARELKITQQIIFCGWIPQTAEFLSILDVFVLSSRWEGMPNVVLEAMLREKPIIAATVGGVPDLLAHEQSGLLIPTENPQAYATAMLRMLHNPGLREVLASSARKRVLEHFSLERMVAAYENLYETI